MRKLFEKLSVFCGIGFLLFAITSIGYGQETLIGEFHPRHDDGVGKITIKSGVPYKAIELNGYVYLISTDTVKYRVINGTNHTYIIDSNFRHDCDILDKHSAVEYEFPACSLEYVLDKDNNQTGYIKILKNGKEIAHIGKAKAFDKDNKEVSVSTVKENKKVYFVSDSTATRLDPTIIYSVTGGTGIIKCSTIFKDQADTDYTPYNPIIGGVGDSEKGRAVFIWQQPLGVPATATVDSAGIYITVQTDNASTSAIIEARGIKKAITSGMECTYNQWDDVGNQAWGTAGGTSAGTDYYTEEMDSTALPNLAVGDSIKIMFTKTAKQITGVDSTHAGTGLLVLCLDLEGGAGTENYYFENATTHNIEAQVEIYYTGGSTPSTNLKGKQFEVYNGVRQSVKQPEVRN